MREWEEKTGFDVKGIKKLLEEELREAERIEEELREAERIEDELFEEITDEIIEENIEAFMELAK